MLDADRAARLAQLAARARSAATADDAWAASRAWADYEVVRDGGRDPDDLLAEGLALSRLAIDLAAQAERPER